MKKILVTGAVGQIGSELVEALRDKYGNENVVAAGHRTKPTEEMKEAGPFEFIDVLDKEEIESAVKKYNIDTIYHMGAILSATGEEKPQLAFRVNIIGLYNILEVGREQKLERIMVPSSIAAFGPDTPKENTPNETILRPTTMYGISKVSGELLGDYYFRRFGLDVRGVRYPGIISNKTLPGGGTTDYAVEIFYEAIRNKYYVCFLKEDSTLPMMYMPDAIRGLIELAEADINQLKHHSDFNLAAVSFSPGELVSEIQRIIPDFTCDYKPDFRQEIADSWPSSIDDSAAQDEWGWKPEFDLRRMTEDMIEKLRIKLR
ncbi:NAD-dependent epimerase/dehydratase family protein [candidate division WOR-3 bacterium]|nr:NAD-dependent epimerase/dehydratase family protein [candidate division WOR-3 bacterium]MCK4528184.1 NAD-dependent epimerase/dehydratase family protein [candidate division WOR-3 bacterium]